MVAHEKLLGCLSNARRKRNGGSDCKTHYGDAEIHSPKASLSIAIYVRGSAKILDEAIYPIMATESVAVLQRQTSVRILLTADSTAISGGSTRRFPIRRH